MDHCEIVRGPTEKDRERISRSHHQKNSKKYKAWRERQRKLYDPRPGGKGK